jgi:hypothetical protein
MTTAEIELVYANHVNLIRKTVREFIRKMRVPTWEYDELFSQSNLYFMLACESFDETRRFQFSTWLRIQIWFRLLNNRKKTARINRRIIEMDYSEFSTYPAYTLDLIDELGRDGLRLVALVKSGRMDLDEVLYKRRNGLKAIFQFLRNLGWTRREIHRSFKEIRRLLVE